MVTLEEATTLLQKPADATSSSSNLVRAPSSYKPLRTFDLPKDRSYQQQYADVYFLRLTSIRPAVDAVAAEAWDGTVIGGEEARHVNRVLDVRQGELCWVTGTVYMDMALKPNILEDVSKDRWISAPISTDRYYSDEDKDTIMLEDDSGRIRLVGDILKSIHLVTGTIIGVMGSENANGELEVIDVKFPDIAPQPTRWTLANDPSEDHDMSGTPSQKRPSSKIAIVSGLSFSGTDASYALELFLLQEYLLGEALSPATQSELTSISRLIIAGNSIDSTTAATADTTTTTSATNGSSKASSTVKKYGYDASAYNPLPSQLFDDFLADLLPSLPVTLMPGTQDPANASYPQQPIHAAMFPRSRPYCAAPDAEEPGWLDTTTNPWEGEVDGWRVLGTGGQNVDDVFKYVDSDDRLGMMEAMCRWRCSAPTAPDTLWAYPFQDDDPFVMKNAPHLFFAGCQPEFSTKVIEGGDGQQVRLITVPSFAETKELVLVDTETLEVSKVKITTTSAAAS
ncbi:DNA polymerase alpha/epsilon subunit B [Colletotrichum abscissum]|uniref:DNA-directed DNA polymerase n=1 Tax=Colletotrichum abscissum TaxID=1671311 RepID=A0A9P9XF05_9PEZI|nr:DNA polymerase alpha/epsilon subunit B [Colletotrichum abscissum]KAI3551125.1 DNA polymerase alpha/epsilon subunit B [Colletotrichum abscissum]KAK1494387.1 DNA polymerase alpha/epsilon subunit B [Colletotrichum abscissum]